ncbi:MAG: ATP-binding protein [Bacteroidetes bacterium]|nr:ATP-binding protein [Bacteroidota bacterium]
MKFYNRQNELQLLDKIEKRSNLSAQMTFVVGRRRIGKTSLLVKATENTDCVYLFVAKKSEVLLCAEFIEEIKQKLKIPIFGEIKSFSEVFGLLMNLSKTRHFTVIIDEFQEFTSVNSSVYSQMQNTWDANKDESKINLILCGSVYSMMTNIFENSKEPLFGRATQRIHLKAFDIATLKEILHDHVIHYHQEDLLAFYLFTGGVAKYVELLVQAQAFTFEEILNEIISENSLFIEEGKNVLIEEFGKEYGNYFSILSLIASGKTSRTEIESIMEIQTGGFLDRLENEYGLIKKVRPILAKPNSRTVKYSIEDNFLKFWFRFIYKYRSAVEAGNLHYLKEIVLRDYSVFSGTILEKYFTEKLKAEQKYNVIGSYWKRNNQNEIDIVAIDDLNKTVLFAEVKRNKDKIKMEHLIEKSQVLIPQFTDYELIYRGFSIDDM